MKIKSLNDPKSFILVLIWSLFMGVTAISIGLGAAFPALNSISQPFVCSSGHLQLLTRTSHPQPGVTYTAEKWQCVDYQTGEVSDVNEMSMFLINGLIYGTILFAVIYLWWWVRTKRRSASAREPSAVNVVAGLEHHRTMRAATSFDIPESEELRKLMSLRDEGLITEQDYDQKKAEILSQM